MLEAKEKNYFVEAEVEIPYLKKEIRNVAVKAKNKDVAIEKYKQELKQEGISVVDISKRFTPIPGIIFLGITVLMSFFRYFEKDGFNSLELYPNIVSLVLSIVIYSAFVIRIKGIESVFKNFADTLISVLFILTLGVFITIFTGDGTIPSGVIGKFLKKIGFGNSYVLIISAIILSWLGLKQICGFAWLAVIGFGFAELITCGNYLGNFKGSIFILSAFLGCIFYLKYEGRLIVNSFKKMTVSTVNFIGSDIKESQALAKRGVSKVVGAYEAKLLEEEEDKDEKGDKDEN